LSGIENFPLWLSIELSNSVWSKARDLTICEVIRAGADRVGFVIGMVIALGCILGGFAAMGGHLSVIWQPWEFVIIGGASLGTFIIANPMSTIKDAGRAMMEAILDRTPTQRHYLDVLGVLYTLMRELRG